MRRLVAFILFWGILGTGCGPSHEHAPSRAEVESLAGTTGATDERGTPFITPDPRMQQALSEPQPAPTPPPQQKPPETVSPPAQTKTENKPEPIKVVVPKKFPLRMNEFEISRFSKETEASRFGDQRMVIKVFFDDKTVKFEAPLEGKDGHYSFKAKTEKYFLSGTLDDDFPHKTTGDLKIVDTDSGDRARVLYHAFKATLNVREDISKPVTQGSELDKQIRGLRENTFGWVNNWSVVHGTSFYLIDIVKIGDSQDPNVLHPPLVGLKGKSLRTGDADHPVESILPYFPSQVALIGNSETEDRRWFQTKLVDPQTKEENEIIIDVQSMEAAAAQKKLEAELEARQAQSYRPPPPPPPPAQPPVAQQPEQQQPPPEPQANASGMVYLPDSPPSEPPVETPTPAPSESPPVAETTPAAPPAQTPNMPPLPTEPPKYGTSAPKPSPPATKPPPPVAQQPPKAQPPQAPAKPPAQPPQPQPQPAKPAAPPQMVEIPTYTDSAYLRIDNSRARTARMTRDFDRNRNLPGVKKWIADYTSSWKGGWGKGLLTFYYSATSFRPMLELIAQTYDVSPAFAYVTVVESAYFTGGNYVIQWGGAAYGPFQFEAPTANRFGVKVGGGIDERKHFAPSACGAAKYFVYLADMYPNDATMAIMGYNMGEGGAAGSIVCTYDRSACGGTDYGRLMARARNYRYTFADIATVRAAPAIRIAYVEKKLAAYFISNDLQRWGIQVPQPSQLPTNGKVFPPSGNGESPSAISDPVCRQAVSSLFGS